MSLDMVQILDEEGKRGVAVFQKAVSVHRATSKTEKSAYYKIEGRETKTTLTILARDFVQVLETGSRPAKTQKPSKEMIAELKPWAQARGIPEEAVYPIAVKLLKEGQQVNRNVYSDQMSEWADEVADKVTEEFAGYAIDKMLNTFK